MKMADIDSVIADLDFAPHVKCDCGYPVPHLARYVVIASCGCIYVICEAAMWQAVTCVDELTFCHVCLRMGVFVLNAGPIERGVNHVCP